MDTYAKSFVFKFFTPKTIKRNKIQIGNTLYAVLINGNIRYGVLNSKMTKNANKYSAIVMILFIRIVECII